MVPSLPNRLTLRAAAAALSFATLSFATLSHASATPGAAAQSPARDAGVLPRAIVLNSRDADVSLLDQKSFEKVGSLAVGKEPHHLYPTPDGRSLIIGNAVSNELHFVDPVTGALQRRVRNIEDPYQIGFSPDQRWFVVNALRLDRVDVYRHQDGELKLARRIALPRMPSHMAFSADSRFVFVTLQGSDEIAAVDLTTLEPAWRMPVGKEPAGIWLTPDERHLLVGVMGEDHVVVIDRHRREVVKRIVTGKGAHNFRPLGDRRHLFVSNRMANTITMIDMVTLEPVRDIAVPGGPDCMEVTADGRQLWVTARFAKRVVVVDIASGVVLRTVVVGRSPHGIYLHNRAGQI